MLIKASTVLGLIIQMFLILAILLIDGLSADPILRLNAKIQHKLMYGDISRSFWLNNLYSPPFKVVPKYKNIRKASVVKADGHNRWPNAVVPYEMSDQYNDEQ
jgi:hypothetical protein